MFPAYINPPETSLEDVSGRHFWETSPGHVSRKRLRETSLGDVSRRRLQETSPGDVSRRRPEIKIARALPRYFHVQEMENSRGPPPLFSCPGNRKQQGLPPAIFMESFFLISIFFDIGVFWNFDWKFKFLGRICFEMDPYGSDLAQNYTQLLQIGFPSRFDRFICPNTLSFKFLKSCNFQKIAGRAGHPPRGDS